MLAFETIGNATLICHDDQPVLLTDPWFDGPAYFGSWALPFEVPAEQREMARACEYLWISHGHPDHLSLESLDVLGDKKVLVSDHVGGRVAGDLRSLGFDVTVLEDRRWYELSPRIKVLTLRDTYQDSALFIDMGGTLIANLNDAGPDGFYQKRYARKLIAGYDVSFLLKKCTYRDADMINFFGPDGKRIDPDVRDENVHSILDFWCGVLQPRYFIPFSHYHHYQREDSVWANEFLTDESVLEEARPSSGTEVLPAFIRYDVLGDSVEKLNPPACARRVLSPEDFGDSWSDELDPDEERRLRAYFDRLPILKGLVDFIDFRVGGRDVPVVVSDGLAGRGLTFEVPRQSLMTAIDHHVFDDLLICNFTRAWLHGKWRRAEVYPYLSPAVPRYADNGGVQTREDLRRYLAEYRRSSPLDYLLHTLEMSAGSRLRPTLERYPALFNAAVKTYGFVTRSV